MSDAAAPLQAPLPTTSLAVILSLIAIGIIRLVPIALASAAIAGAGWLLF